MLRIISRVLSILAVVASVASARDVPKGKIEKLVAELRNSAVSPGSSSDRDTVLAEKFAQMGPQAILYLLPLLQDKNDQVCRFTGYVLSAMPGLAEKDLDALIAARRVEGSSIPKAVAKIDSPRAAKFVVDELLRAGRPEDMVPSAVAMLGPKAVPELVRALQNKSLRWDERMVNDTYWVLGRLGPAAIEAVAPLLTTACDETALKEDRTRSIFLLGAIGPAAEGAVPQLQRIRQKEHDEDILFYSAGAIKQIKSPEAVPILLEELNGEAGRSERKKAAREAVQRKAFNDLSMLTDIEDYFEQSHRTSVLRDIGELGANGAAARPAVEECLTGKPGDVQSEAARTLGKIGAQASVPLLIAALHDGDNYRLVLSAADALCRLRATEAEPALKQVAEEHWSRPVRAALTEARRLLREGKSPDQDPQVSSLGRIDQVFDQASHNYQWISFQQEKVLGKLRAAKPDWMIRIPVRQADGSLWFEDHVGIAVEGGHLIWERRGSWSGAVGFVSALGVKQSVMRSCIDGFFAIPGGAVLVNPPVDIDDSGDIYRLAPDSSGRWTASVWKTLPSASGWSRQLSDGRILISVRSGPVILSPDGHMEPITEENLFTLK